VVFRIAVFYVGSLILPGQLLPYTAYQQGASAFVTFFSKIGVPAAGFTVIGVFLNLVVPSEAFNIALDLSALGIIASWGTIVICQFQVPRPLLEPGGTRRDRAHAGGRLVPQCAAGCSRWPANAWASPVTTASWRRHH
jgi:L-asparagine transporter-like permease